MTSITHLKHQIVQNIKVHADVNIKAGAEKYFKNVILFHGLKAPTIDALFKEFNRNTLKAQPVDLKIDLAITLLQSDYHEEKKVGILILNSVHKQLTANHLTLFEKLFAHHIFDWATCDTFSSKVIALMIKRLPTIVPHIVAWKDSKHLWQQRAACISFISIARFGNYNSEIITICTTVIQNNERFAQLGVGWVLRELSLADLNLVTKFIKKYYSQFSREGLRYAIEKMKPELRNNILKNIF